MAWAVARPRLTRGAMALAFGVAAGLGHAPYDLPLLSLLGLAGIFWLWRGAGTPGRAAALAWLGGVGYFGLTLSWIVEPFLIDIARHGVFAPFAIFGISAGLALFWALAGWLAWRLADGRVAGFAAALTLAELARSVVLTGFPWALPAYIWTDTPLAQTAALVGPHGLTLITLALAGLLATLRPVPVLAAVLGMGMMALWGHGTLRLGQQPAAPPGPVVRLVQPNAPQHLKWRPEMMQTFLDRQLAASAAPADPRPDVIIWPEAAVPVLLGMRPEIEAEVAAAGQGALSLIGIRRYEDERWYNALAAFAPDGTLLAQYDKQHLVPFGEYMPGAALLDRLGLSGLTEGLVGGYSAGPGPALVALPGLPAFQPLICYEVIFPHEILRGPARPGWLVQITNDAWFGTFSGPYQHLAQARMRAIEQGLPLARSANTGVSAVIDPYGQVVASLPLGGQGFVDASLPAALPPTVYARTGDLPAALAALLLLGLGWAAAVRRPE